MILLTAKSPDDLTYKGLKSFEVGRPKNCRQPPYKRFFAALAIVTYLAIGLALWIAMKLFSKSGKKVTFSTIVFKWILIVRLLWQTLSLKRK